MTWRAMAIVAPLVMLMRPDSDASVPVIIWKMVVFPAPFWPISAIFDPSRTEKSASWRIGLRLYSKETLLNRRMTSLPGMLFGGFYFIEKLFHLFHAFFVVNRCGAGIGIQFLQDRQFFLAVRFVEDITFREK